jgi:radical SAM protein with 4Fe4S-binding SPASM domain
MDEEICSYPFSQLFLMPGGMVTPCCYLAQDPHYYVGDIRKQSLEEMWNSEKMQALRKEFLSGKPVTCKKQMQASQCNLVRKDLKENLELKEVMPFPMVRLDMMLNGLCNLKCVMCKVWTQPNGVYTKNQFWEEGQEKIFPYLEEVDIKGGEPFIQKEFFRLIDEVSAVNSRCIWEVTTNAHYDFTDKIKESLKKVKIARLSVSIDSLDPENFAKIRIKGDLSIALRTLDDFIEFKNTHPSNMTQICANFVVQEANWHEVPAFFEFCRDKGIVPFYIILTNPEDFSILNKPLEQRLEMIQFYIEAMSKHQDKVYNRVIRPLLETLPSNLRDQVISQHSKGFREMESYDSIAQVVS